MPLQAAAGTRTFGTVLVPDLNNPDGDESFIGIELNPGLTWRFAPGLTLDLVYAHLFSGAALNFRSVAPDGAQATKKALDADLVTARVRFTF